MSTPRVRFWCGFHSRELIRLIEESWLAQRLFVLVPVHIKDFSFFQLFDIEAAEFLGDWTQDQLDLVKAQSSVDLSIEDQRLLHQAALGVFTSGTSSGAARLVFYSRENVIASLNSIRELFELDRIKQIFTYPQPTHTFGLVLAYIHSVHFKIHLEFAEGPYSKKTHQKWLECIDENTLTLGTPTHFIDLISFVKSSGANPKASYSAIIGGARTTRDLWFGVKQVLNIESPSIGYGATEASPGVTHLPPGIAPTQDGDIGFGLNGVAIQVTNEGLSFKGPNLCLAIFQLGKLHRYDEIVLRDQLVPIQGASGIPSPTRFSFVGRTDFLVNRGGLKLSLENIEGHLSSRLDCKCLALSFFDKRLGEDIGLILQQVSKESPANLVVMAQKILRDDFALGLPTENLLLAEIPVSSNSKFDRRESTKLFLKKRKWDLPVAIDHIKFYLPHHGPAVWVDSMLETKKHFGISKVILSKNKNYFTGEYVRESACIEWVAQTYGYTVALNDLMGIAPADPASKSFIAEVKTCNIFFKSGDLKAGDELLVEVRCTYDFGSLKVVEGKVLRDSALLAQISMKLYCG